MDRELKRQLWASDVMNEITDEHAIALDIAGWKIVRQEADDDAKWPFIGGKKKSCPAWCENLSKPKLVK